MQDKILIVDDEQEIADLVSLYLTNEGFQVFKFYNAANGMPGSSITRKSMEKRPVPSGRKPQCPFGKLLPF